jgi:hypothetical protein
VAAKIPGRTDTQCRYQYTRLTKSAEAAWTPEEDDILLSIVNDNPNWLEIANIHYRTLLKDETTKYKTPPRGAFDCKKRYSLLNTSS